MNILALYHDMKNRSVRLEIDGECLLVDAPAGELTENDKANLAEAKPRLLKLLRQRSSVPLEKLRADKRRFDARPSRYAGYTSLYDSVEGTWHDFPTKDCYPSIVGLANKKRSKGRAV